MSTLQDSAESVKPQYRQLVKPFASPLCILSRHVGNHERSAGLQATRRDYPEGYLMNYQTHPDSSYGIELRDGQSIDDYIAKARQFRSTDEFREYRDGTPERRAQMQRDRNRDNTSADSDDDDRRRTLELLRIYGE